MLWAVLHMWARSWQGTLHTSLNNYPNVHRFRHDVVFHRKLMLNLKFNFAHRPRGFVPNDPLIETR